MQTRIKFCGLTRQQDVQNAVALGVDALGFVFVKNSARNIDVETAVKLVSKVPPFIIKVGLFMNMQVTEVENIIKRVKLNLLQFHGDEEETFCAQFNMPYLKAVPMASTSSLEDFCQRYVSATGFILDSHAQGQMGGSGEKFTWNAIPKSIDKPIILAGGLTVDNVAEAIRVVNPYAVDVSSGIEAGKGIKDPAKMEQFIKEVHRD
ncbi:MAG: phosphoribosylanthranilate isomerase [Gammaproteobacteria bacterium]|nr:MAG: phosphoribosylanthranilate isomerase [Gammaproteobacteria bacterium]